MDKAEDSFNLKWFFVSVILWLACCFVFWVYVHDALIAPAVAIADGFLQWLLPGLVNELRLHNGDVILLSNFGEQNGIIMDAAQAGNRIAFEINPKIISYSLPFLSALLLATSDRHTIYKLLGGALVLYPFIILGIIFIALKELMLGLGNNFSEHTADIFWMSNDVVALGYQLSTLIIPAAMPVLVWSVISRDKMLLLLNREK